jgi:hypothetical protein
MDSGSEDDRDSNRPGTYEFLKYNQRHLTSEILFCSSMGNLRRLKMVLTRAGKTIRDEPYSDYDRRTPLHVAASDGSVIVTNWLIEQKVDLNPLDRWGMTPLEGAVFGDHQDIVAMLQKAGGLIKDRGTGQLIPLEESHVAGADASNNAVLVRLARRFPRDKKKRTFSRVERRVPTPTTRFATSPNLITR